VPPRGQSRVLTRGARRFPQAVVGQAHYAVPRKRAVSEPPANATAGANATATVAGVPASCATAVTPACLQAIYGIPTTPATQASNRLGVPGFGACPFLRRS
jgi:hypothetical protein